MTDPNTPSAKPSEVQSLVDWAAKEKDAIALKLKALHITYGVIIAVIAVVVFFVGREWYKQRILAEAALETKTKQLVAEVHSERAAADSFRTLYDAAKLQRKVDTVRTLKVIAGTQTFTAPVPMKQPDGSISIIPMPVVLASDNDATVQACARERKDCDQLQAAVDSMAHHDSLAAGKSDSVTLSYKKQLANAKGASKWTRIEWAVIGAIAGRASCVK